MVSKYEMHDRAGGEIKSRFLKYDFLNNFVTLKY